jgi:hypothetical protein
VRSRGILTVRTRAETDTPVKRMGVLLAAMLTACGPARQEYDVDAGTAPAELGSTLNVRVEGDSARLELHVTNVTTEPVTLEFATSQRYDFEVLTESGERLWRWSDEMMFAQVLGEEVLAVGETRSYSAPWPAVAAGGAYVARAQLTSLNYPVALQTVFRVDD